MTAMRVPRPDGAVLAAQVAGQRGAPVLVLLQGQASSHDWWTGIRSRYEHRFHTVTMDYRGTGRTLTPEGSLPTGDTLAVLDALEAGQAHVYGTSMGGRVAQMLAAQHPDRVASLVLACSSPGGPHAAERNAEVRKALVAPDPAARQAALMRLLYTPEWGGDASRSHLFGDPSMSAADRQRHLRMSARHDAWDLLPHIASPDLGDARQRRRDDAGGELTPHRGPCPRGSAAHPRRGRHGFFDEFAEDLDPVLSRFWSEYSAG